MSKASETFWSLLYPWRFMAATLYYLPGVLLRLIQTSNAQALLSWTQVQNAWFSAFWAWAGPNIREGNGPRITALLDGRVKQAREIETQEAPPVGGVVLDIGPGLGYWVDLFAKVGQPMEENGARFRGGTNSKIYGVEPNGESHAGLLQRIRHAGLDGKYEILPAGIQSLSSTGKVEKESVDCIVSLLCLCSIPEPEANIRELYQYLKKGGRWYVYEHVKVKSPWSMRLYQRFVNLFWPHALGGCQLCRDTERYLREAGPWGTVDLAQPPTEPWHQTVPHVLGTLTK